MTVVVSEEVLQTVVDNGNALLDLFGPVIDAGQGPQGAPGVTSESARYKDPVKYALTYPVPAGGRTGLPIADGRQTVNNDTVLDFISADRQNRGIWIVHAGAWERRSDFDSAAEINGAVIVIQDGDTMWGKQFRVANTIATIGTDALEFASWEGIDTSNNMRRKYGVLVDGIDSNTGAYNGTQNAWESERGHPRGPLAHWTRYMMAVDGMKLALLVNSIATGDRNAPPVNYTVGAVAPTPKFDGNVWRYVNAKAAWINIRGLTNDLGIYPRTFASGGTRDAVRANLRTLIAFLKAQCPYTHIELDMPQPFEQDFVTSGTNVTQFALADPANPTVAGGAAFLNKIVYDELTAWDGRILGVTVFNSMVLTDSTEYRCDDKATQWLDREADEAGVHQPLVNNGLHATDLCEKRRDQEKMRRHCSPQRGFTADYMWGVPATLKGVRRGHWVHFNATTHNGGGAGAGISTLKVRGGPEYLAWLGARQGIKGATGKVPTHEALANAERLLFTADLGQIEAIKGMHDEVFLWFPASNNEYASNAVGLGQDVMDASGEWQHDLTFAGPNFSGEMVAAGAGLTPHLQRAFIFVRRRSALPFITRTITGVLQPGTAAVASQALPNPYATSTADGWPLRSLKVSRFAATDGACSVDFGLSNVGADNRLADYAAANRTCTITGTDLVASAGTTGLVAGQQVSGTGVTAGTVLVGGAGLNWVVNISQNVGPVAMSFGTFTTSLPLIVATATFTAPNLSATLVFNQANINQAQAAGIGWPAAVGNASAYPWFKGGYRLMVIPSITLTRPINFIASEAS